MPDMVSGWVGNVASGIHTHIFPLMNFPSPSRMSQAVCLDRREQGDASGADAAQCVVL